MNKSEIMAKIEDLSLHRDIMALVMETFPDREIKEEIAATNKAIRELKSLLLDMYLAEIKEIYPGADALYGEKISWLVGRKVFDQLWCKGKITLVSCINGHELYLIN